MPKITKHAEFLETLRGMVTKEGAATPEVAKEAEVNKEAEKPTATGKPGADTHPAKTPESTEHVNKNEQGRPEKNPQDFKQEKAKDGPLHGKTAEEVAAEEKAAADKTANENLPSTGKSAGITANAKDAENKVEQKKAEDTSTENMKLAEMGQQLLQSIKAAMAQEKTAEKPTASGVPGQDTHPASTAPKAVNKNEHGHPEHNPQEFKQEKGKDAVLHAKSASEVNQEDLDKQASFELGRQFCRNFLQTKVASKQEVYKEAGRRDFEALIAQAASELETQKQAQVQPQAQAPVQVKQASAIVDESYAEKQAEEAGAQAFYSMMKQAQDEYQAEQVKLAFEQRVQSLMNEKTAAEKRAAELEAELKTKVAAMEKKAEEEKRAQEFHTWGNYVVEQMMTRLQSESPR